MQANVPMTRGAAVEKPKVNHLLRLNRLIVMLTGLLVFFPQVNPGRILAEINHNLSLFTTALSYSSLTNGLKLALRRSEITPGMIYLLMAGSIVMILGILLGVVGSCMSLGNNRMKRVACLMPMGGGVAMLGGLSMIYVAYRNFAAVNSSRVTPMIPDGLWVYAVLAVLTIATALLAWLTLPKEVEEKMAMDEKYRLFLMFLPVLLLTFIFCYLPIYGWRFAFFDYQPDGSMGEFMGLYWFKLLFGQANMNDMVRVLRNTLAMSGLGILTSWFPVAFAILLAEVKSTKFQRFVQTFTTIPNFISWVLVYSIALAIFSTDGFLNSFLRNVMGVTGANTDYLASADHTWIKMLLWGTWKGLGWSAIVYIAGISGIDQQLYEAARVDGANRFRCIWHITVPGLMPTYCVMLLMSVAGILSNGMEQYLVFHNAINRDVIQVLDLYVYQMFQTGSTELSIVVGMAKSIIGVVLLFAANGISKVVRGESII